MFLVLWEFEVKPGCEQRFERVYGSGGDWDSLFRRDAEHAGTYLFRDTTRPRVYLTADQSPARNRPFTLVSCLGRQRSTPGSGQKVAAASLMTVALIRFASRALGSAFLTSFKQRSMISCRGFCSKSYEALTTNCRYWPLLAFSLVPLDSPYSRLLLKTHCVVVSSSVTKGSVITSRSNQKCTPVIGALFSILKFRNAASCPRTSPGISSAKAVCVTAKM